MGGGWEGKRTTSLAANQGGSFNVLTPWRYTFSVSGVMDRIE